MKNSTQSYRPSRGFLIALGMIILPICMFNTIAYRDNSFICENTASKKEYREWFCGWKTGHSYCESSLEVFMREHYPKEMAHHWTRYASIEGNFFGITRRGGHGMPGPVLDISSTLDRYMALIDDSQKKALYDLLASTNRSAIYAKEIEIYYKLEDSK